MQIYVVGGAVRDVILGLTPKDIDYVVVGSTVDEMLALNYTRVGADFPVFLDINGDEYALARTERKTGDGYHGFDWDVSSVTLEEDLMRRDLTMNSLAVNVRYWELFQANPGKIDEYVIDPFNGVYDITNKIIRHTSNAFAEDPVRILRTARFAARYSFDIHVTTMALMNIMVQAGQCDFLTAERVWAETEKVLKEQHPSIFIDILKQLTALPVIYPGTSVEQFEKSCAACQSYHLRSASFEVRTALYGFSHQTLKSLKAPSRLIKFVKSVTKFCSLLDQTSTGEQYVRMFHMLDLYRSYNHVLWMNEYLSIVGKLYILNLFHESNEVEFSDVCSEIAFAKDKSGISVELDRLRAIRIDSCLQVDD